MLQLYRRNAKSIYFRKNKRKIIYTQLFTRGTSWKSYISLRRNFLKSLEFKNEKTARDAASLPSPVRREIYSSIRATVLCETYAVHK